MSLKLILFFTFILFSQLKTFSQGMDSLSKFSYFLFAPTKEVGIDAIGQKVNKSKIATVFFIRKNNNLYLFSAAHSISGLNHDGEFEKDFPDTFYLRLYKPDSEEAFDLKFNPKQIIGGLPETSFYKNNYDIVCFQMVLPAFDVKSIEKFITEEESVDQQLVEEALVYGFAAKDGGDVTKSTVEYKTMTNVNLNGSSKLYNSFHIKSGMPVYGFSGSPMFLRTNTSKIIFGGMAVAGTDKVLTFIPPQVIREILSKL